MIERLVSAIAAALFGAIAEAWREWRRDRDLKRLGWSEAERAAAKATLDDLRKVNDARDRLARDPDYARRVRGRFTRHD